MAYEFQNKLFETHCRDHSLRKKKEILSFNSLGFQAQTTEPGFPLALSPGLQYWELQGEEEEHLATEINTDGPSRPLSVLQAKYWTVGSMMEISDEFVGPES